MSTSIDPRRSIAEWLESEAPDRAPARLIDASRERIRTTRQRRAWWPARRASDMNTFAKLAIATAAVVVVAIVGYNLLPGRSSGVGGLPATPSPSISASPSASGSASASPMPSDAVREGSLEPGSYTHYGIDGLPVNVRFTVPAGWSWVSQYSLIATGDPADEIAIALWSGTEMQVYSDPCQWEGAEPDPPTGPTARELVDALAAQPTRNASAPTERKAAGPDGPDQWPGWVVELTVPEDVAFDGCSRGEFRSWGPDEFARYHQGPGQSDTVWAIDIDSDMRMVIDATYLPGAPPQTRTEIEGILDSIVVSRTG